MQFNPNTMPTIQDAQLSLIDQGYENIDDHPVLERYDDNGDLIKDTRSTVAEDFVVPQETSELHPQSSTKKIHRIAEVALDTTKPVTVNQSGVVMTPREVAEHQNRSR